MVILNICIRIKMERWENVIGYDGKYQVSNLGRVRVKRKTGLEILEGGKHKQGYIRVSLTKDKIVKKTLVHILVASTFIPTNRQGLEVNHKNGVKEDNRVDNLEWVTASENLKHAFSTGLRSNRGSKNPRAKLDDGKVFEIRKSKKTNKELAQKYEVTPSLINMVRKGKIWKHI